MIANLRPDSVGVLDCMVEECDLRLTAEKQEEVLGVVADVLGGKKVDGVDGEGEGANGDGVNGYGVHGDGVHGDGVNGDGAHADEMEEEEDGAS